MHLPLRIAGTLTTALSGIGTIVLLTGCGSQPATMDYYMRTEYQIIDRAPDIIRAADDVIVLGGELDYTFGPATYSGNNLWDRLRDRMGLVIAHNPRVDKEIRQLKASPRYLKQLSRRARPYLHFILSEIERRGLPGELALLPEIESNYNPRAVSPKSAAGMWQIIPQTGRRYGLEQNTSYDERNDIRASTRAALDYLQWLHREFQGDWALALAGYNAGEGLVAKARRRNRARGKPTDFWSLDLPTETARYVPKLLAVAKLIERPTHYGMRLPSIPSQPHLKLVDTRKQ